MAYQPEVSSPLSLAELQRAINDYGAGFILFGSIAVALGVMAIAHPYQATASVKVVSGWIILAMGISRVIEAACAPQFKEFFDHLLTGMFLVVAGGWLALFPLTGILTLTFIAALVLMLQGLTKIAIGMCIRSGTEFVFLIAGFATLIIGGFICGSLPITSGWAIGFLIGINLIGAGVTYILLAVSARLWTW